MSYIENYVKDKKILIATFPADGHFNPITGLAKHLVALGCDVRWYTSTLFAAKLEKLGIKHYPFEEAMDVNAENVEELFPERKNIDDAGARADFDMKEVYTNMAPGQYMDIKKIAQRFEMDLIITDSLFPAIPFITAKLNIPHVGIGVIPLASESRDLGPFGLGLYPPQNQQQRDEYAAMRTLFNEVVFRGSIDAFSELLAKNNIVHRKSLLFDLLIRHCGIYLQIGCPSFEFERSDIGDNVRFVGSLLPYTKTNTTGAWTDERIKRYRKVAMVTQGTVERDTAKLLEPTLEAFKDTDVLVIATTGGNGTAALMERYPYDNIIIEDYIPFDEVMPQSDIYITNGGYSGTLLAIKHKLPLVAAGIHEGKAEICSRIGFYNYGINLQTESPTPKAIKDAVEQIFADNTINENVERLHRELNNYSPLELATSYIAEQLLTFKNR